MEKRDAEIVAPDLQDNPWPVPMGYPVILADGKAYYFACASPAERTKCLLEGLDAVKEAESKVDSGEANPSEFVHAASRLAATALSLQYSTETVERLIEYPAITTREYKQIAWSVMGNGPGYEVIVKKK